MVQIIRKTCKVVPPASKMPVRVTCLEIDAELMRDCGPDQSAGSGRFVRRMMEGHAVAGADAQSADAPATQRDVRS